MFSVYQETKNWIQGSHLDNMIIDSVESTNDEAKTEAHHIESDLKVYLTDEQEKGRGRGDNTWSNCKKGEALLITFSFKLNLPPQHITAPLMGLSLYKSVQNAWPSLKWSIKPPNDLYLEDKKIAGILTETVSQGELHRLIVGLGLNVFSAPSDIVDSTYLTAEEGLGTELEIKKWFEFLSYLKTHLSDACQSAGDYSLSEPVRDELLKALNSNPFKKETYIEVQEDGSLVTESGSIPWQNI